MTVHVIVSVPFLKQTFMTFLADVVSCSITNEIYVQAQREKEVVLYNFHPWEIRRVLTFRPEHELHMQLYDME